MFRRRRSLCPSAASDPAPSPASPPPPWVWPEATTTDVTTASDTDVNCYEYEVILPSFTLRSSTLSFLAPLVRSKVA